MFITYRSGRNGKSKFLEAIQNVMGTKEQFTFKPQMKLWMSTNNKPEIPEDTRLYGQGLSLYRLWRLLWEEKIGHHPATGTASELHELRQYTSHMDTIRLYGKRPYSLIAGRRSGVTSSPRARASW